MTLPAIETRFAFFTGKGGVGKTSLACASAVQLAEAGQRVLLVSTDPASNLDEVLETPLSGTPTPVAGVPGLSALNVDPEAAAAAYRERMVGPYRGVLPAAAIRSMEEQFSGGCTVEIAAFDAFAELLAGHAFAADFDHVVFDTAPTGHTLRLLSLPSAWSDFLATNTTGTSCLGPLAGLEKNQATYAAAVRSLAEPASTTVVLVARPDRSALREAERTRHELAELGVRRQVLALNGVYTAWRPAMASATRRRWPTCPRPWPPCRARPPASFHAAWWVWTRCAPSCIRARQGPPRCPRWTSTWRTRGSRRSSSTSRRPATASS
jgi:arsenite-transporting ATPase